MKKVIWGKCQYNGKPARIYCTLRDTDGYISITGGIIPYRCRTEYCCGCIHAEISKAFPKLRKYLWLHLIPKDGGVNPIENTLYALANDNENEARMYLHCTEEELREISAFARYGLCRRKAWYSYSEKKQIYTIDGKDSKRIFADFLKKFKFEERRKQAIKEFYEFVDTL